MTRWFAGYRMIVFGGLVAVLLIVRPRGLLDERLVHRIRRGVRRRPTPSPANTTFSERSRHDRRTSCFCCCRDRSFGSGLAVGIKARAEVSCAATAKPLEYDCTIKLSDQRSGAALTGVE